MIGLRLYLSHGAGRKDRAVRRLEEALARSTEPCRLEIVDMLEHPDRALADLILVTPTLVRHRPSPVRRVCGDLSDPSRVLMALGLSLGD